MRSKSGTPLKNNLNGNKEEIDDRFPKIDSSSETLA